jgi:hypothetical protein
MQHDITSTSTRQEKHPPTTMARRYRNEKLRLRRGDETCARCRSLGLHQLLKKREDHKSRIRFWKCIVRPLGTIQSNMLCSECPLCRLFATIFQRNLESTQQECVLKMHSAVQHHFRYTYKRKRIQDTTILSVSQQGALAWNHKLERQSGIIYIADEQSSFQDSRLIGKRINPLDIDYEVARNWIQYCKTQHSGYCNPYPSAQANNITGFKLIDCDNRRVSRHTERVDYIALSYVWGSSCYTSTRSVPNPASRVIEDAIIVTKRLGFRYLWVDRYCISQLDPSESQLQISKMDQIYANAVLTIVAGAGEGPGYGLPGVSQRPRHTQPCADLGGIHLVTSLRSPQDVVKSSKWASRGWTFQEAKLSRRTLFFTDDQLFFECASMSCQETIQMPLEASHQGPRKGMGLECNEARIFPPNGPVSSLAKMLDVISDYTSRHLSQDSDNVNAILGIFNAFQFNGSRNSVLRRKLSLALDAPPISKQIYHLWGMPILPQILTRHDGSLLNPYFSILLAWQANKPSTRCYSFPSWSWAGWRLPTKIHFRYPLKYDDTIKAVAWVAQWSVLSCSLCTSAGMKIAFNDLEQYSQADFAEALRDKSHVLVVRGIIGTLRFRLGQNKEFPLEPFVQLEGKLYANGRFWPDVEISSDELADFIQRTWTILWLNNKRGLFLVLKRVRGDNEYERIGMFDARERWTQDCMYRAICGRTETVLLR